MRWPAWLRGAVYLRRSARALESIALSQQTLAAIAERDWNLRHPARKPRAVEISVMDQTAINRIWKEDQEAAGLAVEDVT